MAKVPTYKYYNDLADGEVKQRWWLEDKEEIHQHVFGHKKKLNDLQSQREFNMTKYAQMYNDRPIQGISATKFTKLVGTPKSVTNRVSYNVIKSAVDTAAAKLAKNKPRPLFLTERGNFLEQERAKLLGQFVEGTFDCIGTSNGDLRTMYGIGRRCFVDSAIFGLGAAKFFIRDGEVKCERVLINELLVDELEGMHEMPRQMHQVKLMHRELVADLFPKYLEKIMMVASGVGADDNYKESTADLIEVIESWHLPSGEGASDGKHCISIENCTLYCEDYKKDHFPFAFLRWSPSIVGFFGTGIAEELQGIQLEINKLLRRIQESQHLMSVPQVWLDISNRAHAAKHSNKVGGKYFYSGTPPVFMNPQAMPAEVYRWLDNLYQKAFEIVGISQLSAQSKKPSGLDSGVAIREFQDIESERFMLAGQRYEEFFMDAARIVISMMRDIQEDNPSVKVKDGDFIKRIKWKDVDMADDKYTLRVFPAGALPQTPAGKLQKVQELTQAGFFSKDEAFDLLDMPDLRGSSSITLASRNAVKRMIERIISDGEAQVPTSMMDLDYAIKYAQAQYNLGLAEEMPPERLDLLASFVEQAQAILNPPQPPMPEMPPELAGGALPPEENLQTGQPGEPPVADLLPVPEMNT